MMTEDRATRRIKDLGALQDLLLRAAPEGPNGETPSITTLAKALALSHWSIYVWIKRGKVPAGRVRRLIEVSEGRVAAEEFHAFTYI